MGWSRGGDNWYTLRYGPGWSGVGVGTAGTHQDREGVGQGQLVHIEVEGGVGTAFFVNTLHSKQDDMLNLSKNAMYVL